MARARFAGAAPPAWNTSMMTVCSTRRGLDSLLCRDIVSGRTQQRRRRCSGWFGTLANHLQKFLLRVENGFAMSSSLTLRNVC